MCVHECVNLAHMQLHSSRDHNNSNSHNDVNTTSSTLQSTYAVQGPQAVTDVKSKTSPKHFFKNSHSDHMRAHMYKHTIGGSITTDSQAWFHRAWSLSRSCRNCMPCSPFVAPNRQGALSGVYATRPMNPAQCVAARPLETKLLPTDPGTQYCYTVYKSINHIHRHFGDGPKSILMVSA